LRSIVTTEYNIEGNPTEKFIELVLEAVPEQVTLVPDTPEQLTSNAGWDTRKHVAFLREVIARFKSKGIRTSIFVDTNLENIRGAVETGCDRVELYTEPYALAFSTNKQTAVEPFVRAAQEAVRLGLGVNAGHDLSLENLRYFAQNVPGLLEVSIGHALISDALYYGLENTVQLYLRQLK
jgi:pyridoxine 5-phosphate synthase